MAANVFIGRSGVAMPVKDFVDADALDRHHAP
jgi:hypothetical protein